MLRSSILPLVARSPLLTLSPSLYPQKSTIQSPAMTASSPNSSTQNPSPPAPSRFPTRCIISIPGFNSLPTDKNPTPSPATPSQNLRNSLVTHLSLLAAFGTQPLLHALDILKLCDPAVGSTMLVLFSISWCARITANHLVRRRISQRPIGDAKDIAIRTYDRAYHDRHDSLHITAVTQGGQVLGLMGIWAMAGGDFQTCWGDAPWTGMVGFFVLWFAACWNVYRLLTSPLVLVYIFKAEAKGLLARPFWAEYILPYRVPDEIEAGLVEAERVEAEDLESCDSDVCGLGIVTGEECGVEGENGLKAVVAGREEVVEL